MRAREGEKGKSEGVKVESTGGLTRHVRGDEFEVAGRLTEHMRRSDI